MLYGQRWLLEVDFKKLFTLKKKEIIYIVFLHYPIRGFLWSQCKPPVRFSYMSRNETLVNLFHSRLSLGSHYLIHYSIYLPDKIQITAKIY